MDVVKLNTLDAYKNRGLIYYDSYNDNANSNSMSLYLFHCLWPYAFGCLYSTSMLLKSISWNIHACYSFYIAYKLLKK